MDQQQPRKQFFRTNRFQRRIIALTFAPLLAIIVFMWVIMDVFYKEMVNVILYQSSADAMRTINHWGGYLLLGFLTILIGTIFWAFSVSLNLVGAFERIIRELDEMIEGESYKTLRARPKDELANELLKRINVLIELVRKKSGAL